MKKIIKANLLLITLSVTMVGCEKENPLFIGQKYEGGIIAYIDNTGKHGLIAAPYDQSNGIQWYNGTYDLVNASSTAIGDGNSNTEAIVNIQGNGKYAAKICYDLEFGGYSDWFLPSMAELNQLYINKDVIGNFGPYDYWSSTENSGDYAWSTMFDGGNSTNGWKHFLFKVRAVRKF